MPSRRRSQFSFVELIIRLVGVGLMIVVGFCYLPGGGGARAVAALERLALTVVGCIAVLGVIVLCVLVWISKSRRSKSDDANHTAWQPIVPPSYCLQTVTAAAPSAEKPVHSRLEPAPLTPTDILAKIRSIDWYQFEKLVALIYRKLGYTVESRGGANPDGGIDLIIQKDGQPIAVQCKHWQNWDVKVKTVREFVGALADAKIKTGILVTLNGYTGDAKLLADRNNIAIINQTRLVEMLEQADVRFDPEFRNLLTDTHKVCPKCESELVIRTTKSGPNAGRQFWGCSTFPVCRFQMPIRV